MCWPSITIVFKNCLERVPMRTELAKTVVLKVGFPKQQQQQQKHLGTHRKYKFLGPTPDLLWGQWTQLPLRPTSELYSSRVVFALHPISSPATPLPPTPIGPAFWEDPRL